MTPLTSLTARWRELLARPMHPRTIVLIVAVALAAFAAVLAVAGQVIPTPATGDRPPAVATSPPAAAPTPPAAVPKAPEASVTPSPARLLAGKRVARRFLRGYLAYTYGRLRDARRIEGADPAVLTQLAANPPRVPAGVRRLRVSFVLHVGEDATRDRMSYQALVNDHSGTTYTVLVAVQPDPSGHLRVTTVNIG